MLLKWEHKPLSLHRVFGWFKGDAVADGKRSGRGGSGRKPGTWVTSSAYRAVITALVQARKKAGLSQRDLAEALDKEPSFVAKIERRERRLDVVEFIAIARALDVKELDLLKSVIAELPKRIEI